MIFQDPLLQEFAAVGYCALVLRQRVTLRVDPKIVVADQTHAPRCPPDIVCALGLFDASLRIISLQNSFIDLFCR